jgi:hypothetical protein
MRRSTAWLETDPKSHTFPLNRWASGLPELARQYRQNSPVPHIVLSDFADPELAQAAAQEFPPKPDTSDWTVYQHPNENKQGLTKRDLFPPSLGELCDSMNTPEFVGWLSELTGIPNLLADPSLEGGGLHRAVRGGFLNVHTDFSHHHYNKNWRRRINLILYLNPEWYEAWNGGIELWDNRMQHCVAKYVPLLNRVLIFNTDENSYHGFPEPLACPEGTIRKSLALYYYTVDEHHASNTRSTDYRPRPNDGIVKAATIWADKHAVNLYSKAKATFGFSDEFASKILKRIFRRKN